MNDTTNTTSRPSRMYTHRSSHATPAIHKLPIEIIRMIFENAVHPLTSDNMTHDSLFARYATTHEERFSPLSLSAVCAR